jgi:heme/copper-type cytochrome/quinol oxidase subunit 2
LCLSVSGDEYRAASDNSSDRDMPKNKLVTVLIVVALFLLVPFVLGRITVAVLNATYPSPPAPATTAKYNVTSSPGAGRIATIRAEAEAASRSLERARAITRIALIVIAVYYVALISALIIRRSRKRKLQRA